MNSPSTRPTSRWQRFKLFSRYMLKFWPWFTFSIVLGHLAKEKYFPFSHWPMYASFSKRVDYVFFETAKGDPIPAKQFEETSARLKRQFNKERAREFKKLEGNQKLKDGPLKQEYDAKAIEIASSLMIRRLAERLPAEKIQEAQQMRMIRDVLVFDEDENGKSYIKKERYISPYIDISQITSKAKSSATSSNQANPIEDEEDPS